MKIQCTDSKTFELSDGSEKTGQLIYKNLFSFDAQIHFGGKKYDLKPDGLFSTSVGVFDQDQEVAGLKMNWKGQIVISLSGKETFIIKAKGAFLNKYVLEDDQQQQLLLLNPDFNWAKFNYNYEILKLNDMMDNTLLVLLSVYSANYFIAAMSASI